MSSKSLYFSTYQLLASVAGWDVLGVQVSKVMVRGRVNVSGGDSCGRFAGRPPFFSTARPSDINTTPNADEK